ncbi:Protoporphyrinogen oxidase [Xylona heveae TC161]|uniref:Protoporphyrinogen oxidase n=1 Tax=Xylona heveae (strain CBS 132557 / TC161) TaxID=1328760 RepID=A0A165GN31_XYLHT|nr:Protoporphyrinogen oxidase [Xylona heveae TC161]KZF22390.1 Protoporphyrinogen oxidase [Xylona heveae TC161]
MAPRHPENLLEVLLKQCYLQPRCAAGQRRPLHVSRYTTQAAHEYHKPDSFAVLGGGISGLASAFYLSKKHPDKKITLYEQSSRVGGWVQSKKVDVGDGSIVFEEGPRTLRCTMPNGMVALDLIRQLGLENEILRTKKDAIAARNRFIYYPDHLVRVPGPGSSFFSILSAVIREPVFRESFTSILREPFKTVPSAAGEDESVGSFLERYTSTVLVNNLVSPLLHGIYAGDVWKLSVNSIFPMLPFLERTHGGLLPGALDLLFSSEKPALERDTDLIQHLLQEQPTLRGQLLEMKDTSVFTLKGGLGSLVTRLEEVLQQNKNVVIRKDAQIEALELNRTMDTIQLTTNLKDEPKPNHAFAISTLPAQTLAKLAPELDSLNDVHSVTVMIVSLFFNNPNVLPANGFGYLIPQSIPLEQNPERALGVVFDSDAAPGVDTAKGTKVTVMLGGHWWDDFSSYPDEEEGMRMARTVLARHLGIVDEPIANNVRLLKNCLPQYTVGHQARLGRTHRDLQTSFRGRLRVAGNSYGGVGINDCIRSAYDVAMLPTEGSYFDTYTGLNNLGPNPQWVKFKMVKRQVQVNTVTK